MSYRPLTDVMILARTKHGYYGGYPAGFLHRGRELLGVCIDDPVLHVCSGRVKDYPYPGFGPNDKTVDINPAVKPSYVMDVRHALPGRRGSWRAMMVDTPYSSAEAEHYGTAAQYPEPGPLLKLCLEHTRPGGRVGFLHWEWPRPPAQVDGCTIKEIFVGLVTTGRGCRARHYVVFEKVKP